MVAIRRCGSCGAADDRGTWFVYERRSESGATSRVHYCGECHPLRVRTGDSLLYTEVFGLKAFEPVLVPRTALEPAGRVGKASLFDELGPWQILVDRMEPLPEFVPIAPATD